MSEKRQVHTDALETLGTIIGPDEKRDAIHLAVIPIQAHRTVFAGEHIDSDGCPKHHFNNQILITKKTLKSVMLEIILKEVKSYLNALYVTNFFIEMNFIELSAKVKKITWRL